MRMPG